MKALLVITIKALGIVVASYGAVIGMAFAIDKYFMEKAEAVVDSKIEVIKEIRKNDMEHLNHRFDRLETLIRSNK